MSDYLQQFKHVTDQLAASDSLVFDDDNVILYVVDGLPPLYRQFGSSIHIRACMATLSLAELHTLLICEEITLAEEGTHDLLTAFGATRPSKPHTGRGQSYFHNSSILAVMGPFQRQSPFSNDAGLLPSPNGAPIGATNYITPDIEALQIATLYAGTNSVQVGNGQGQAHGEDLYQVLVENGL
ncbi:hypothetical protein NE237_024003 [Protea cynaroides]|uniref:Uncharacterized protein n=1 Tax=Protea cynaroides TaxID=273540 RepID=A0A9Q0HDW1_9MAGN|nr:hypothetical protein NE237_024003 [Protea cynaroides]